MKAAVILNALSQHTLQHQIDKFQLLYGEHDPIHLPAHLDQYACCDLLGASDPLNGLVVPHDAHLRHLNPYLLPNQ